MFAPSIGLKNLLATSWLSNWSSIESWHRFSGSTLCASSWFWFYCCIMALLIKTVWRSKVGLSTSL